MPSTNFCLQDALSRRCAQVRWKTRTRRSVGCFNSDAVKGKLSGACFLNHREQHRLLNGAIIINKSCRRYLKICKSPAADHVAFYKQAVRKTDSSATDLQDLQTPPEHGRISMKITSIIINLWERLVQQTFTAEARTTSTSPTQSHHLIHHTIIFTCSIFQISTVQCEPRQGSRDC